MGLNQAYLAFGSPKASWIYKARAYMGKFVYSVTGIWCTLSCFVYIIKKILVDKWRGHHELDNLAFKTSNEATLQPQENGIFIESAKYHINRFRLLEYIKCNPINQEYLFFGDPMPAKKELIYVW